MTVSALDVDVDFERDLGIGVVGVLKDGSLRSIDALEAAVGEVVQMAIMFADCLRLEEW